MNRRLLALMALLPWAVHAEEPGIYAGFSTSEGAFTVRLDYEKAPMAVAAFVGLATGKKAWLDAEGAVWLGRPFYDGTIFLRVLPGLAIQGGGAPEPAISWERRNNGPSWLDDLRGTVVVEVPPGGATNDFGDMDITFINAAAVPVAVSHAGQEAEFLRTNLTRQVVQLVIRASGPMEHLVNTNVLHDVWVTNASPVAALTECTGPISFWLPTPRDRSSTPAPSSP